MRFIALLFSFFLGACSPQAHVLVANDCPSAYLRVSRLQGAGDFTVVHERLMPGEEVVVSFTGTSGGNNLFVLKVTGFRLDNNETLGSLDQTYSVSSGNGPVAPENNYSWSVRWLPRGCPASS